MKIWEPKPPGTLWATPGLLRDSFTFIWLLGDDKGQFIKMSVFQDDVLQNFICDPECDSRELLVRTNIVRSAVTLRSRSAKVLRDDPVKINLVILCVNFSVHLFALFVKSFKAI